jgi:AraC-like DNA-binding protein
VDANFLHLRSVNDVADHFFYSREYISRSFQKYFNTPLYDYILNRKMMHCCTLLQQGELVESAARKAGFHNLSSFVKVFRKRYGCNPSEYKAYQHPL